MLMFGVKKALSAVALVLVLATGALAQTTSTSTTSSSSTTSSTVAVTSAVLTYVVTGHIYDLPGYPSDVIFTCSTTAAVPACNTTVGNLAVSFDASDATHFRVTFLPTVVCGATVPSCTPLSNAADATTATFVASLSSCRYVGSLDAKFYFPCKNCFGGISPVFRMTASVVSSFAC